MWGPLIVIISENLSESSGSDDDDEPTSAPFQQRSSMACTLPITLNRSANLSSNNTSSDLDLDDVSDSDEEAFHNERDLILSLSVRRTLALDVASRDSVWVVSESLDV